MTATTGPCQEGIAADRLSVSFGEHCVLAGVSFTVAPGTVYGLLGRNGAGKTTTLRVLAGLVRPAAGDAWLASHSVLKDPVAAKGELGFVPDDPVLFAALTATEHLELVLGLRADRAVAAGRIARVLRLVGLGGDADRYVGQYSHGMRQRLALAMALAGNPSCLVLDEPASGLDPGGRAVLTDLLRQAAGAGHAVVLASHQLELVREVCDQAGILHQGAISAEYVLPADGTRLEQEFYAVTGPAPDPDPGD